MSFEKSVSDRVSFVNLFTFENNIIFDNYIINKDPHFNPF